MGFGIWKPEIVSGITLPVVCDFGAGNFYEYFSVGKTEVIQKF